MPETAEILQNHLTSVHAFLPNCESCKRTKVSYEIHKVTYTVRAISEKSLQSIKKSSMKKENRGTIKGMQQLYKIWPPIGFEVTSTRRNPKVLFTGNALEKLVNIFSGTILRLLFVGWRHKELQKEH